MFDTASNDSNTLNQPSVSVLVQTITVAGFEIEEFSRNEHSAFCYCKKYDVFGNHVKYLICLTGNDAFETEEIDDAKHEAKTGVRSLVFVSRVQSSNSLSWHEFLETLGGAVPTWRALADTYRSDIQILARNALPRDLTGEAWLLFENAVSDGLEFVLGRRVRRLGGKRRGQDVPDGICLTPDRAVLVIDAKASVNAFGVTKPELRPLEDYVRSQSIHQIGQPPVGAAVLVAADFRRSTENLVDECARFQADTSVPLSLLTVGHLLTMVDLARDNPTLRNAVRWRYIFCRNGIADSQHLSKELQRARDSRLSFGE